MARRAAAALQRGAEHRVAQARVDVERRAEGLGVFGRQPFVVDAVAAVGVDVALRDLHIVHGVGEHHHAARREHDVVVEDLREVLPHLHRVVVEAGALVEEVVGTDDGGVAAGVAAADPTLLEHSDAGETVLGGEVIGRPEPMAAAADDDRVVLGLRLRTAPLFAPSLVLTQAVPEQRESREALA